MVKVMAEMMVEIIGKITTEFYPQLKRVWRYLAALYGFAFVLLAGITLIRVVRGTPIEYFTRDLADVLEVNPFYGVISSLGILLWCAAAAICVFAAQLLRERQVDSQFVRFFWLSSLISSLLLVDDLFQLHEQLDDIGIKEPITYGVYGLIILAYLIWYSQLILETEFVLLVIAFGFFGLSIVLDSLGYEIENMIPGFFLFEDGFKLLGIMTWVVYLVRTAFQVTVKNLRN